jgi:hypothetical protein
MKRSKHIKLLNCNCNFVMQGKYGRKNMITVKNVSHDFEIGRKEKKNSIPVLKDVSFEIVY